MAQFILAENKFNIAQQIADMLNSYNRLYKYHDSTSIIGEAGNYFIEIEPGPTTRVVGCIALVQEYPTLSKIKHLSVLEGYRERGIGKKLIQTALDHCVTKNIYMTVRKDNIKSWRLACSMGFLFIKESWSIDHQILVLGRSVK